MCLEVCEGQSSTKAPPKNVINNHKATSRTQKASVWGDRLTQDFLSGPDERTNVTLVLCPCPAAG